MTATAGRVLFTIDATAYSAVIACECGWRDVYATRYAAWTAAARHESAAHPGNASIAAGRLATLRHRARKAG